MDDEIQRRLGARRFNNEVCGMPRWVVWSGLLTICSLHACFLISSAGGQASPVPDPTVRVQVTIGSVTPAVQDRVKSELQKGTDLTRRGLFEEAIPHLLESQRVGSGSYATSINLGISYVGLGRYKEAIAILDSLRSSGADTGLVENLLTQAYLGDGQLKAASKAFLEAATLTPKDETLYAFVADACTDHQDYAMGLHVAETGLQQLPKSSRLHYERALFLSRLDRMEEARPEFDQAAQLGPGTYIANLAMVQKDLYDDHFEEAKSLLRGVIRAGHRDYQTLSLLGTVLMHLGVSPDEPEFAEAQAVLEESAKNHPNYSATQIALGKIYNMEGRYDEAVEHLEIGRRLEPENPAIYANLSMAYRNVGDVEKAKHMQEKLARLLGEKKSDISPTTP